MQEIQEILDQALKRAKNGEQIASIVLSYPAEVQNDLKAMLEIVNGIYSLPRRSAPLPNKRRLFLQTHPKTTFTAKAGDFFTAIKVAPLVATGLLAVVTIAIASAASSLPGDRLFALKKTYNNMRLGLISDPANKAQFQLEIANQRLQDAQKLVALNDQKSQETIQAAIKELNEQTAVALNDAKKAAAAQPGILSKAENLATDQQNLIAKVNPDSAKQNAQQNSVALGEIKSLIAAPNETTNVALKPTASSESKPNLPIISPAAQINVGATEQIPLKPSDTHTGFILEQTANLQ